MMKCDSCSYTTEFWSGADEHELSNIDHWVNIIDAELLPYEKTLDQDERNGN